MPAALFRMRGRQHHTIPEAGNEVSKAEELVEATTLSVIDIVAEDIILNDVAQEDTTQATEPKETESPEEPVVQTIETPEIAKTPARQEKKQRQRISQEEQIAAKILERKMASTSKKTL